ncbi:ATP-binding protein [Marinobacter panjinensis]|uniref:ATP-binding protein n=1 Tax=Marinobacter panjinensis TaxID=2576384 RepID=A0A4U6R354_9GAMM|nr:ATP-binding protein [Marinobacter panjinensis]MCR8913262.1 ATP-binding protein [Marinobacter panjinensis]TKV68057.1 ATP-binding protein [Marinobacter panjinensis]
MVKLIVVGPRCAGKSVLGAHLEARHKLCHVEASDVMRMLFERDGKGAETLDEFAARTLIGNPCAVPNELFRTAPSHRRVVLTGLRSMKEIDCVRRLFGHSPLVLYVDAFIEVRVARCVARGRPGSSDHDANRMDEDDRLHVSMGLNDIRDHPDVLLLENNFTQLTEYFAAAELALGVKY